MTDSECFHRIAVALERIADAMESPTAKPKRQQKRSESVPDGFEEFWCVYPRKVAKIAAMSAWKKLNLTQQQKVIRVIPKWAEAWNNIELRFVPHASTWLNAYGFEDEIEQAVPVQQEDITKLDDGELLARATAAGINTVGLSRYELIDRIRTA